MRPYVYRIEIGESPQEESARLNWQHYIDESVHQTGESGLIQGLLVLSGPQITTKKIDKQFGLIVKETNQTKAVFWLGSLLGPVIHLAATHSELDSLPEKELRPSLNLLRQESPEFYQAVIDLLAEPDHTLKTRPTAGSANGNRTKTIFSREQLSSESFQSVKEHERITKKIEVPGVRRRALPIERTVGSDKISF